MKKLRSQESDLSLPGRRLWPLTQWQSKQKGIEDSVSAVRTPESVWEVLTNLNLDPEGLWPDPTRCVWW